MMDKQNYASKSHCSIDPFMIIRKFYSSGRSSEIMHRAHQCHPRI